MIALYSVMIAASAATSCYVDYVPGMTRADVNTDAAYYFNGRVKQVTYRVYKAELQFGDVVRGVEIGGEQPYGSDGFYLRMTYESIDQIENGGADYENEIICNGKYMYAPIIASFDTLGRKTSVNSQLMYGIYSYDEWGNVISADFFSNKKKQKGKKFETYAFTYTKIDTCTDAFRKAYGYCSTMALTEINQWQLSSERGTYLKAKTKLKYDERGRPIKIDHYLEDGSLNWSTGEYSYGSDGYRIWNGTQRTFENGYLMSENSKYGLTSYTYDVHGNCTRAGNNVYEYKYDNRGNWIERIYYTTSKDSEGREARVYMNILVRDFVYY